MGVEREVGPMKLLERFRYLKVRGFVCATSFSTGVAGGPRELLL